MKCWEIIADNLKKRGWSLGWISALDFEARTIWIVDAHCGDGNRFVVHADEKLTAFLELERVSPSLTEQVDRKSATPGSQNSHLGKRY
jgi:hypothetical protein